MSMYLYIYVFIYLLLLSLLQKRPDQLGRSTSLPCNDAGFLSRV